MRFHSNLNLLAAIALCFCLVPSAVKAGVIVDVAGADDTGVLLGPGVQPDAAAMAFSISDTFTNVSISAPISCVGCSGAVWLHQTSLGGAAQLQDLVSAQVFNAASSTAPLFTNLTLGPGLYFLLATIDSGFAVWSGSLLGTVNQMVSSGAAVGPYFTAAVVPGFAPFGDFDVALGGLLHLRVEGSQQIVSVSAPSTWLCLVGVLLAVLRLRRPRLR